jgi:hypothetical protein
LAELSAVSSTHVEDASASAARVPLPSGTIPFAIAILTSAFLLFQVQLVMGKFILPWFGGASAVWTTTLLFFQVLLLAGYGYAHFLTRRLTTRRQFEVHIGMLVACAAALLLAAFAWESPITPGRGWRPDPGGSPILQIVAVLAVSVGFPFFLLSATAPLLQRWFTVAHPGRSPYVLYAVSNVGSLLGLLTYPILVEPQLTLRTQGYVWAMGFALFLSVCLLCGRNVARADAGVLPDPSTEKVSVQSSTPTWGRYLLWFALSATGSLLMLATTNLLTLDVAAIPLLWVLPLSIYLLTFILCFESSRWYRRVVFHPLFLVVALMTCTTLFNGLRVPMLVQVAVFSISLFTACMVCHGELALLRPDPEHLTAFYFTMSAGGAAGGLLVNLVVPQLFAGFWEFHLGFWLAAALLVTALFYDGGSWIYARKRWLTLLTFAMAMLMVPYLARTKVISVDRLQTTAFFVFFGLAVATGIAILWTMPDNARRRQGGFRWKQVFVVGILLGLGNFLARNASSDRAGVVDRARNFYGVLTISEQFPYEPANHYFEMTHGRISHGLQLREPGLQQRPTSYFGPESGAAMPLLYHPRRNQGDGSLRVGIIGLGVGTLATYGRPGDIIRYYEINPDVIRFSGKQGEYFSFLRVSAASIDVVLGDARLSLEREAERGELQQFDVLIIDAFSSDSIPVHLLTKEAFELYQKHLRGEDSVIVVQITNRVLNLQPVVAGLADHFGLQARTVTNRPPGPILQNSDYVLLSRTDTFFKQPEVVTRAVATQRRPELRLWADQYSNIFSILY